MSVEARVEALLEPGETLWVLAREKHLAQSVDSGIKGQNFRSSSTLPVAFTDRRMIRVGVARETGRVDGDDVCQLDPSSHESVPYTELTSMSLQAKGSSGMVLAARPCLFPSGTMAVDPLEQPKGGVDKLKALLAAADGPFADKARIEAMQPLATRYRRLRDRELDALRRQYSGRKDVAFRLGCGGCLTVPACLGLIPLAGLLLSPLLRIVGIDTSGSPGAVVGLCQLPFLLGFGVLGVAALWQFFYGQFDALRADKQLTEARDAIAQLRREGVG